MKFEYDDTKSQINKEKHGIDFVEAQKLWQDEDALVVPANIVDNEIRYALISKILTKCFVVIFTIIENTNRIISVRRCRKNEEKNYENNNC
ncbi:BrnT family toxin [Sulfurimonas sp. NW9]|uniref:BrnT family toxin n=1 Tax=Sulfurimonas sp. NW9 TaxID=2922728 RepID=UPI003DA94863